MTPDFSFETELRARMEAILPLSGVQVEQLKAHFDVLQRWNAKMNLTTVRPGAEMVERHYCESLFLAARLGMSEGRVADIGSGPGFPGVPLAIACPGLAVTLVESNQRKAVFLKEACRGLKNVSVLARRASEVRAEFDCLVSRAVTAGDIVAEIPRLAPRLALLIGSEDAAKLESNPKFAWQPSELLPWGDRRVFLAGTHVPRETSR